MSNNLISETKNRFEEYFKVAVLEHCPTDILGLKDSVSYHFGWDSTLTVPAKRLRPLFLILTYASLGGKPEDAYQAASALEILHNFTLIHDDIQDQGQSRHGHPALWTKVGVPLAINIGDYLAGLSQYLIGTLPDIFPMTIQKSVMNEFQKATLGVIQGQQLDIQYEKIDRISVEEYLRMIRLKTGRLFSSAFAIGPGLIGYEEEFTNKLSQIGCDLGLGFQIQDDYLGIWGSSEEIGKSVSTDLLTRKKTFPAMTGLKNSQVFQQLWEQTVQPDENHLREMKSFLERIAVREDTLNLARAYYIEAQTSLNQLLPVENEYAQSLMSLVTSMFAPVLSIS
ncbi:MAG: polyprenyl synthetase family protein [Anaerolineaceae bacterium]|nr:polyprenyl synthetase family protein [Anaerolineaceae bacterium]